MKMRLTFARAVALLSMVSSTRGQGTFVYDQQSVNTSVPAGILDDIQPNEPIGQSFTPSLSAVGFVRLNLSDAITRNGVGAAVYVNLRTDRSEAHTSELQSHSFTS